MSKKGLMVGVAIVACIVLGYFFIPSGKQQLALVHCYLEDMHTFVHNYYWLSVILFILFFVLMILCMIPITVLLSLLGGYLYGVVGGTVYAVLAATIGNICAVFLIRRYGSSFSSMIQTKNSDRINGLVARLHNREIWFVMAANLLPITPGPLITIAVSLSQMSLPLFAVASIVGLIPGTFVYALAGRQLAALSSMGSLVNTWVLLALTVFALGILLYGFRRTGK